MKRYHKFIIGILGTICLISTPIAELFSCRESVPDDYYLCYLTNHSWSIRIFCVIGVLFILFYKEEKK